MKKLFTAITFVMSSLTAIAQVNPGWQTGGGYDSSSQRYHFDRPQHHSYGEHRYGGANYVDLFNGGHVDKPLALSIGYVNKSWSTDFGTHTYKENFWGDEGKRLHGVQFGLVYQPCLPIGLGLHTGLFYEYYYSTAPSVKELGWDNFTENGLYLPVHAQWRVPLGRESSLSVYGGLGINWAIVGSYNEDHEESYYDRYDGWVHDYWTDSEYASYGRGDFPHHLNFSTEFGATVRIQNVQMSATISHGLTNHGFYRKEGNFKTRQNKFGISVAYVFDPNDL